MIRARLHPFSPTRALSLLTLSLLSLAISPTAWAGPGHSHGHSHDNHDHEEQATGAHGGRLLEDGDLSVELALQEQEGTATFRAWINDHGTPVQNAQLQVRLTRLGGEQQLLGFVRDEDGWRADAAIPEPHSFDVVATLAHNGNTHTWEWTSYEGRVDIDAETAAQAGIGTQQASAGQIARQLRVYGTLTVPPDHAAAVRARFPGVVTSLTARLGEPVRKGDTLAVIESNDSLRSYSVRAPIDGVVQSITANIGDVVADTPLVTLVNDSQLWAELKIFPRQRSEVTAGQPVVLQAAGQQYQGSIAHVAPTATSAPYVIARVPLDNRGKLFAPGDLVSADILVEQADVALVVDNRALQIVEEQTGTFVRVEDSFEFRPLRLGRRDTQHSEVLDGLSAGAHYVVKNSYLVKADLEKAGAAHEH